MARNPNSKLSTETPHDDARPAAVRRAEPPRLWTVNTVLAFFGGEKPIDISTLYRGIHMGRYPRSVNIGGARWLADECEAALDRMINERDGRKRIGRRGRKP